MDANFSTMTMPKTMPVQNLLRYISFKSLTSSLLGIICYQICYQIKSDYMDRALVYKKLWKKCLEHQTPGWWVICPIDPAYYNYIEDCRIFLLFMNTYGKRRGGRGGENHKRFKCLVSWTCSLIFHENLR